MQVDQFNNAATGQLINLKQLDQPALDNTKADILAVDATVTEQIENTVGLWIDNQQAKKLYNAVNSVLNPAESSLAVMDFNELMDLLTATHIKLTAYNSSDQYNQSLNLSGFGLKHAMFTLLKARRSAPSFDEIIEDLEKFNFQSKAEHHRESVRTMLRYYCDKKRFLVMDGNEKWSLTAAGEKFFATESELLEVTASQTTTQVTDSPSVAVHDNTSKFTAKLDAGKVTWAIQYVEVMREAGETYANYIADAYNTKHNDNKSAHDVADTLRKNSKTKNPLVKALGGNHFEIINRALRPAADETAVNNEAAS